MIPEGVGYPIPQTVHGYPWALSRTCKTPFGMPDGEPEEFKYNPLTSKLL